MKLRVVFAGTPVFAVAPLRAIARRHALVGVLTQPDRPAGRGRAVAASPVKQAALELGVPVLQPAKLRGDAEALETTLQQLAAWQPDVIVVVAYGLILPRALLELPRFGCLNIHASLLPRWRGAAPIQRAILAGDAQTGIAIMQMDEGLDTGAVLLSASLRIGTETTSAELHDELAALGASEILRALDALGSAVAQPQPADGITYADKLAKSEARIDWQRDASAIDRQIRAFNPWPATETRLQDEPVKLLRSRLPATPLFTAAATPGTLLGLNGEALEVACGQGVLQVLELQRAGRKAVAARDFFNALRPPVGTQQVFH